MQFAPETRRGRRRRICIGTVVLMLAALAPAASAATAPTLDLDVDGDGIVRLGSSAWGRGVTTLDDGRVATVHEQGGGMRVTVIDPEDGSIDVSTGVATMPNSADWISVVDAATHPDGSVIVAGLHRASGEYRGHLAKIDPADGTLVAAFGAGGFVSFGADETLWALAIAEDGTIWTGGNDESFAFVSAVDADGDPLTTFDGDGTLHQTHEVTHSAAGTHALVPHAGGVIACGTGWSGGGTRSGFVDMIDGDGSLNDSFAGGSSLITTPMLRSCALGADDRIWVGGGEPTITGIPLGGSTSVVGRLSADGTLDTDFGAGGWLTIADDDAIDAVHDLVPRRDGGVIAATYAHSNDALFGDDATARVIHVDADGGFSAASWSEPLNGFTRDGVRIAAGSDGRVHVAATRSWLYADLRTYVAADVASAPGSLVAVGAVDSASLSWTAPEDLGGGAVLEYVIEARTGAAGWDVVVDTDGDASDTSATVEGLVGGSEVEFRVAAVTGVGTGWARSTAAVEILEPAPDPEPHVEPVPAEDPSTGCGSSLAGGTVGCWSEADGHSFTDVHASWQHAPVAWLVANGITTGTSPDAFSPDAPVTRGQLAAMLWRMVGSPQPAQQHGFDDVVRSWQHDPVSWMAEEGITTGTTAFSFEPEGHVTRGQMAVFVWRLAGEPTVGSPSGFTDVTLGWQVDAVDWLAAVDITTGTSPTSYEPNAPVSRGQVAALLHRTALVLAG